MANRALGRYVDENPEILFYRTYGTQWFVTYNGRQIGKFIAPVRHPARFEFSDTCDLSALGDLDLVRRKVMEEASNWYYVPFNHKAKA